MRRTDPPLSLPDGPAVCSSPQAAGRHPGQKGCASLLDGADGRVLCPEMGEVQFTEYGLSGICIMRLSGLLAPGRGPKRPVVALDLFPALSETELTALFAQRVGLLGSEAAEFWLGLLCPQSWARLSGLTPVCLKTPRALPASRVAETRRHGQVLEVRGLDALRLEAGSDHRRRPAAGRSSGRFPVQRAVRDSTLWARRWTAPAAAAATTSTGPSAAASSPGGRRQSFAKEEVNQQAPEGRLPGAPALFVRGLIQLRLLGGSLGPSSF